jgi:signal transduction histidine kinase
LGRDLASAHYALAAWRFLRLAQGIRFRLYTPRFPHGLHRLSAFILIALATAFAAEPTASSPSIAATAPAGVANPRFTGTPFLSLWDSDDHGGAPSNYHVVQHPQTGFIYAGNTFGLIEYDGATWRLIPFRDEGVAPIVVIDRRGTIWFGGSNEVAVLQPNPRGELQPVDVTERLPPADRNFGRLYLGAAAPNGVFLASPSRVIFFGHDGTTRSWPSGPTNFNGLCSLEGVLYASKGAAGLVRLEDDAFVPVASAPPNPNPANSATLRLLDARPAPGGGVLFLTNVGPMRWAGRGAPLEPLAAATVAEFADENATTAAFLPDGRLAFSFPRRGLLILDASGTISARLDPAQGFGRGRIEHIATDNQGGLWLARSNGLARLQIDSRYATQGAFDEARAFLRQGERLYISCLESVAWRDDATGRFHPVAGLPTSPSALFRIGDRLFGTGQFLREITPDDRATVALRHSFNSVTPLRDAPGMFVGASLAGLRLLHFDGAAWRDDGLVPGVKGGVRHALQDREGFVWASGYDGSGSWRVDFRTGASVSAPVEYFDQARGLPFSRGRDQARFLALGGETLTARSGALLRYDRTAARFVPEDRLENAPPAAPVATAAGAEGDQWWLVTSPAPQLVHVVPSAENRWRAEPLAVGPLQDFVPNSLHYDPPTRTLWIGGKGAPITVDPAWRPAQPIAPLDASVRRLTTAAGELLWASAGSSSPQASSPSLSSKQNSLRFTFAAPAYRPDHRGATRTVFRTRLDGLEDEWTSWSATPWREFSHLPYRDFVFRVQARDIEARESTVGTLAFSIAPPWWRTWWFIAPGSAAGIALIVGASRWLTNRALKRHVQLLEAQSAVERERLRLARDLHDEVGSGLGRVILFADEAERATHEPEKLHASLARVRSSAQELVQHAREIVWAVNPKHDTLASVIERFGHYTADTLRAAGIACTVSRPAAEAIPAIMLGSEARHSLFLAVKEAVHNCVKYSEAKTAEFRLEISGDEFVIVLRDHGRGFPAGEVRGTGYGTVSIVARAQVLGGRAEISSEVGKGTTVMLRVPLNGPTK